MYLDKYVKMQLIFRGICRTLLSVSFYTRENANHRQNANICVWELKFGYSRQICSGILCQFVNIFILKLGPLWNYFLEGKKHAFLPQINRAYCFTSVSA